jgi:hypothetical protein
VRVGRRWLELLLTCPSTVPPFQKPSYLVKYNDAKKAVPFLYRDGTGTATFLNKDTYTGKATFSFTSLHAEPASFTPVSL